MEAADKHKDEPAAPGDEQKKPEPATKNVGLKGTRALRKLRDRVELAANELMRLREENTALQQRIEELESMPAGDGGEGLLFLDTDPETLKRKVEGFIQSIDNYLENKEPAE